MRYDNTKPGFAGKSHVKDLDVSFVNGDNIVKKYLGIKGLPYKAMLAMNYITAIKKLWQRCESSKRIY